MKTCFFIGHRETDERILPTLIQEVEQHITEYGVTEFVVGHYGGFDRLAAHAVKEAKQRHPEVTLTLLLPYHPVERPIPTPEGFDRTPSPRRRALTALSTRRAWRRCRNALPLSGPITGCSATATI